MSETRILIRLLWLYFARNWEFGSALSKLRNSGGGGDGEPPTDLPRYATGPWALLAIVPKATTSKEMVETLSHDKKNVLTDKFPEFLDRPS
jgi:hypothetical protein